MSGVTVLAMLPESKSTKSAAATPAHSLRSMETIYSVTSSRNSVLTRRKMNQKARDRNPSLVPVVSDIKQRVASARMLRIKQLQNQISEVQQKLHEVLTENRTLKMLARRYELEMAKTMGQNAELPTLLNSHSEEVRTLTTRNRNLTTKVTELQAKLKSKDQTILNLSDQNKRFQQLDANKNLLERAALQERVKALEDRCLEKERDIKLLVRRLQLAEKTYRANLHSEQQKYKDLSSRIEMTELVLSANSNKKIPARSSYNRGITRNKSPAGRIASKSAVFLSEITKLDGTEIDLANVEGTAAVKTILPPCVVSATNNNSISDCVNGNGAKQIPDVKTISVEAPIEIKEVDLTTDCIDKSEKLLKEKDESEKNESPAVKVKNGMHRARQENNSNKIQAAAKNPVSKLSPLHAQKSEKKSTSDESEFSDDDFHFFSDHNGTKMAHRELLEHKMHIAELENKMKQNSLDSNGSQVNSYQHDARSNSSFSSHDETLKNEEINSSFHPFNDRGDTDLLSIQRQMRESFMHRESILDEYCETIVDKESSYYSGNSTKARAKYSKLASSNGGSRTILHSEQSYQANNYHKTNGHAAAIGGGEAKKAHLDEGKKTKLLAVLKNIDDHNSFEH